MLEMHVTMSQARGPWFDGLWLLDVKWFEFFMVV